MQELRQQLYERIKLQGKSRSTFKVYWSHCQSYLRFCKDNQLRRSVKAEIAVEKWLSYLATSRYVSTTTQNVALQAVCYLYREIWNRPLEGVSAIRAKRPNRVRDVLDVSEVAELLNHLTGTPLLFCKLIYGCGLRIGDVASLRVKDISFERRQLHVFDGKGSKDRYASFPVVLHDDVTRQLQRSKQLFELDRRNGNNGVSLPGAFARKSRSAAKEWRWYYLFCSGNLSSIDDGPLLRHHLHTSNINRAIKAASNKAGISKRVTSHVLRHSYATHANEQGVDVTILQKLLGHSHVETTMTYVHANKDRATASVSPYETLLANQLRNTGRPKLRIRVS